MKKINQNKKEWIYSETVKNHFFNPRNILLREPKPGEFDAESIVGSPACGDVMKMWIKVEPVRGKSLKATAEFSKKNRASNGLDPKTLKITKLKWRTFGCASAIASTSMFSMMLTEHGGMKLEDALKITSQDIMKRLGGLPPYKIHCSVLADQAFRKAAKNYLEKNKNRAC